MCCCAAPTINGQPGYRWNVKDPPSVRRPAPPTLGEFENVLYNLPGRCGGQDSHCHHYQILGSAIGCSFPTRIGNPGSPWRDEKRPNSTQRGGQGAAKS